MAVILSSVFCALTGLAQESLSDRLSYVLTNQDMDKGYELYNQIKDQDLLHLPDSVLFDYHYLGAYLNTDNFTDNPNHEKAIYHLKEAKRLCETSLGTYFSGYMEIMNGLGDEYLELKQYENALNSYQEGIVKCMAIRSSNPQYFANLIMGVQECYERLGQYNEVPKNLLDAWDFWVKDTEPFDTYNYFPLWSLCHFYHRYGMYEKALQINDEIFDFISHNVNKATPLLLGNEKYFRGNILSDMGNKDEACKTYKAGIELLKANNFRDNELYGQLLGNLLISSIPNEDFNDITTILADIRSYSSKIDDNSQYINALYSASTEYNNQGYYDLALKLNSELLSCDLNADIRNFILDQRDQLEYSKRIVETLSDIENTYYNLQPDTNEWFETAFTLSSAYFRIKNKEKNLPILQSIYNALKTNDAVRDEYYLSVVGGLFNVHFDLENYNDALAFATEKWLYISNISEIPEKYKYNTLNELIIACLRANKINDIDLYLDSAELLCKKINSPDSPDYAIYLHNRGRAYQLQGKMEEARLTFLSAINMQNKVVGKVDPRTVSYLMEVEESILENELDL